MMIMYKSAYLRIRNKLWVRVPVRMAYVSNPKALISYCIPIT